VRSVVHGNPEVAGDEPTLPVPLPRSCKVGEEEVEVAVDVVVVDIVLRLTTLNECTSRDKCAILVVGYER
jgi:hypothetical protein